MTTSPKQIGYWNGITHGKAQFANRIDAEQFSAEMIKQYADRDCGWYWSCEECDPKLFIVRSKLVTKNGKTYLTGGVIDNLF